MSGGELDLFPRARYSAFYPSDLPGVLVCARCAVEEWGIRSVWRAVHAIRQDPVIEARPLSELLPESPGACCTECGTSFWVQLPAPTGRGG